MASGVRPNNHYKMLALRFKIDALKASLTGQAYHKSAAELVERARAACSAGCIKAANSLYKRAIGHAKGSV